MVSEIGDYFNNIAVFALAVERTGSGLVVSGVMLSRAIPAVLAGPIAGVVLDRFDRKQIMLASDLIRFVVALAFVLAVDADRTWLLYPLSALLMFASPFFTSGRSAILPSIASSEELHAANSLTQTTQWATLTLGTMLAGFSAATLGFRWAFVINSLSFLFSGVMIWMLRLRAGSFRPQRESLTEDKVVRPWHVYVEGLRYMCSTPLILGIAMISVGWATGGGAAQILFTLFGEQVFSRGAAGIGTIWGFAGVGLLIGGAIAHRGGRNLNFRSYKRTITISYIAHGVAYVMFSQMRMYWAALLFILLSRVGMAISSVLNNFQLLRHVPDEFRGRVFSTIESLRWSVMMVSMALAGIGSQYFSPRDIGAVAGVLSSLTAVYWAWADWTGRLPEPPLKGIEPEEIEVHGEPTV